MTWTIGGAAAAVVPGCLCMSSMADFCLRSVAGCLKEGFEVTCTIGGTLDAVGPYIHHSRFWIMGR